MQGIRKIFETGLEDTWVSGLPGCAKPSSGAGWGGEAWCPGRGPCGLNGGKRERERESPSLLLRSSAPAGSFGGVVRSRRDDVSRGKERERERESGKALAAAFLLSLALAM